VGSGAPPTDLRSCAMRATRWRRSRASCRAGFGAPGGSFASALRTGPAVSAWFRGSRRPATGAGAERSSRSAISRSRASPHPSHAFRAS